MSNRILGLLMLFSLAYCHKNCENVMNINRQLRVMDFKNNSQWFIVYRKTIKNSLSAFNPEHTDCMIIQMVIRNQSQFSLLFACQNSEGERMIKFIVDVTRTQDFSLVATNRYNELACDDYKIYKSELKDFNVLATDYNNYLVLYGCKDGFLTLATKLNNSAGIYNFNPMIHSYFKGNLFEAKAYIMLFCEYHQNCRMISNYNLNITCTSYQEKFIIDSNTIYFGDSEIKTKFSLISHEPLANIMFLYFGNVTRNASEISDIFGKTMIFVIIFLCPLNIIVFEYLFDNI